MIDRGERGLTMGNDITLLDFTIESIEKAMERAKYRTKYIVDVQAIDKEPMVLDGDVSISIEGAEYILMYLQELRCYKRRAADE